MESMHGRVKCSINNSICVYFVQTNDNMKQSNASRLSTESIEGASLALQGVHDVHRGDSLPARVLGVRHGITDHVLEEHLEHSARLLVDDGRDTLHSTTASQTADGGLSDALDVIAKHLAMALGSALSQSLSSLATSRHCEVSKLSEDPQE